MTGILLWLSINPKIVLAISSCRSAGRCEVFSYAVRSNGVIIQLFAIVERMLSLAPFSKVTPYVSFPPAYNRD
jgi:hypothetical protein